MDNRRMAPKTSRITNKFVWHKRCGADVVWKSNNGQLDIWCRTCRCFVPPENLSKEGPYVGVSR